MFVFSAHPGENVFGVLRKMGSLWAREARFKQKRMLSTFIAMFVFPKFFFTWRFGLSFHVAVFRVQQMRRMKTVTFEGNKMRRAIFLVSSILLDRSSTSIE